MPLVKVNGIQIGYEIAGDGPPMVLISGLGYSRWQWRLMVPHLAKSYRVLTFDNRGSGETDKPEGPYSAAMLAEDLAELLEVLEMTPAIVLGHSMGGFIAQQLALTRPELVSKLVLASTNFGGPNHIPVTPEAMKVLTDTDTDPVTRVRNGAAIAFAPGFAEANSDLLDEIVQYRLSMPVPPEAYNAQMQIGLSLMSADAAFENKLPDMEIPTLIFFGEYDIVVPVDNAHLLAELLPNSELMILENTGHLFPLEAPERAAVAMIDGLAQL